MKRRKNSNIGSPGWPGGPALPEAAGLMRLVVTLTTAGPTFSTSAVKSGTPTVRVSVAEAGGAGAGAVPASFAPAGGLVVAAGDGSRVDSGEHAASASAAEQSSAK